VYAQSYRKSLRVYNSDIQENKRNYQIYIPDQLDFDNTMNIKTSGMQLSLLNQAKLSMERIRDDYNMKSYVIVNEEKELRRYHIEMHKKFTLSFACLIFFFIGAPLGAIIRKGGLGVPAIISVALFIFYYIIDKVGFTMATNGMWMPWQGMWFSSAILFPLGIFLTYKAANDSVLLNGEVYIDKFKKLIGIRSIRKIERKEIVMYKIDNYTFIEQLDSLIKKCDIYIKQNKRWPRYFKYWEQAGEDNNAVQISNSLEQVIENGHNSEKILVIHKLSDFPIIEPFRLFHFISPVYRTKINKIVGWIFPLGILLYLFANYRGTYLLKDIQTIRQVSEELVHIVYKT